MYRRLFTDIRFRSAVKEMAIYNLCIDPEIKVIMNQLSSAAKNNDKNYFVSLLLRERDSTIRHIKNNPTYDSQALINQYNLQFKEVDPVTYAKLAITLDDIK